MKNKIAVFSLRAGWGGAEKMAIKLAEAYAILGHDVCFYYIFGELEFVPRGIKPYKLKSLVLRGLDKGDKRSLLEKITLQLVDLINVFGALFVVISILRKGGRPDVIHFNKIRGLGGFVFFWSKLILKSKVFYTAHDYEYFSPDAKQTMKHNLLGGIYRKFKKPFLKYVDLVVCPSKYVHDSFVECFDSGDKVRVIKNFCFEMKSTCCNPVYKGGVLGYMGRLEYIKGITYLTAAFEGSNSSKLIFCGDGSLSSHVSELAVSNQNVEYLGVLSGEGIRDFFAEIDVLVVPSVWEEVYGLVVEEALANNVPSIVSDQGGLPEFIKCEELGRIIEISSLKNPEIFRSEINSYLQYLENECVKVNKVVSESHIRTITDFMDDISTICLRDGA